MFYQKLHGHDDAVTPTTAWLSLVHNTSQTRVTSRRVASNRTEFYLMRRDMKRVAMRRIVNLALQGGYMVTPNALPTHRYRAPSTHSVQVRNNIISTLDL